MDHFDNVDDDAPIPKETHRQPTVEQTADDNPLTNLQGNQTQNHISPPAVAKDLTPGRPSQAPNPHNGGATLNNDHPVSGIFKLYKWHPFTELFCVLAEWFEAQNNDIEQRKAFAESHPKYFKFALFADFGTLAIIVTGILLAIAYIALRTIGIEIGINVIRIPIYWPEFGKPEN